MQDQIIEELTLKGELGEFLGEGNDRIVYAHAKNPNLVIKIPKHEMGFEQNKWEASHYLEEENLKMKMGKEFSPNGLARCALVGKCLYMQKLKVTEGSDFGVIEHSGIIRRFDLNIGAI